MGDWPFVGREAEAAALHAELGRAGGGALIVGEPGVGKSRLAREVVAQCRTLGRPTEWVAATAAASEVPFGALTHLLPAPTAGGTGRGDGDVFREVVVHLGGRGAGDSVVLGIDDAHHLDAVSAAVVHHLASSGHAVLIVTTRTGERLPEPLTALRKAGALARHELGVLDEMVVGKLLEQVLGGQVAAATVHRLMVACGGNALYLRELVADGFDGGTLVVEGGVWRWSGQPTGTRLRELLAERLDDLRSDDRRAVEILALGEPLEADLLARLTPRADLEALERLGLVSVDTQDDDLRLRLAHPVYADTLRTTMPELVARRARAQLAEALERRGVWSEHDALRVATWRIDAGEKVDPTLLLTAGYRAKGLEDYVLAERLARAAAQVGDQQEAWVLLGAALSGQGRVGEAEELFTGLEAAAGLAERADIAVLTALEQLWFGGRRADAEKTLRRATELAKRSADPTRVAKVASARTGLLLLTESTTATLASARQVVADPHAGELAVLQAVLPAGAAGRAEEALSWVEWGLPLAPRQAARQPAGTDLLLLNRSQALRLSGRLGEALALAERGTEASVEAGAVSIAYPLWLTALGQAHMACGTVDEAVRRLREAVMWMRGTGSSPFLILALANLAQSLGLRGDGEEARAVLDEVSERRDPGVRAFDCDLHLAHAWACAAAGELTQAGRWCLAGAEAASTLDQHAHTALALADAARLGSEATVAEHQVTDRLAELSLRVEGSLAPTLALYVRALADRDPVGGEQAAAAFEKMAAHLLAAEAWVEASRIWRDQGHRGSARTAQAHARAAVQRCAGVRTPVLSRLRDEPFLTRREHEVATLAAGGLSNRAIADRLYVSLRTVENHLHNVYRKLGVRGRAQLVELQDYIGAADDVSSRDSAPDR